MIQNANHILYISTNPVWSGSEELWSRSAQRFVKEGAKVATASLYTHPSVAEIGPLHFDLKTRFPGKSLVQRALTKLFAQNRLDPDQLYHFFDTARPELVVISQGDNIQGIEIMSFCKARNIPYVTITQLVAEFHIYAFNNDSLLHMREAYLGATKNYFVSQNNLNLNNRMLGLTLPNAEVVFNPCKCTGTPSPYPEVTNTYHIALVGRLDCYHKGYDLLIEVLRIDKWRSRNVRFHIYGDGPGALLLKTSIENFGITNLRLKGHVPDVREIWKENHLLLLPSRMEGQALSLIEAMWNGRAAVATNVGGAAELIRDGENGFLAQAATVECVDEALERAWNSRERWRKMGLQAAADLKAVYPEDAVSFLNNKIRELIVERASA